MSSHSPIVIIGIHNECVLMVVWNDDKDDDQAETLLMVRKNSAIIAFIMKNS